MPFLHTVLMLSAIQPQWANAAQHLQQLCLYKKCIVIVILTQEMDVNEREQFNPDKIETSTLWHGTETQLEMEIYIDKIISFFLISFCIIIIWDSGIICTMSATHSLSAVAVATGPQSRLTDIFSRILSPLPRATTKDI